MSLPDKHDKRRFRHVVKLAADGTVLAVIEVADGKPLPPDSDAVLHVDATPLYPFDLGGVKLLKAVVDTRDPPMILAALKLANKVPKPTKIDPVADGG